MDNKRLRGPADRRRVNLSQRYERVYWCHKFRCTELELQLAVMIASDRAVLVGQILADARKLLRSRSRKGKRGA